MKLAAVPQEDGTWVDLKEQLTSIIEQKNRDLKEITLMIEQSQIEMQKLALRNSSITTHLHQVQSQIDSYSRSEIKSVYDSALDTQQRLFVMRGQVEKLQSDRSHLTEYINVLENVNSVLDNQTSTLSGSKIGESASHVVEMLIQAQEGERQRLSRQMHDGPAQALSNFILQTEIAMRLFDMDAEKARAELENLKLSATSTFQNVRDFIFELRPMMLDDLGLVPTLKRYIEIFKDETKTEIRMNVTGRERRLEAYQEVMVFRAIQELLENATRHSQASLVKVQLDISDTALKVVVDDDGRGFDPEKIEVGEGMGLKVIRDRVEMMGGTINFESTLGKGTHIIIDLPVIERKGIG